MSGSKLTPEHHRILRHKVLSMNRTPQEVIDFLTPLAVYDRGADKIRKGSCGAAIVGTLIFVIALFTIFDAVSRPTALMILGALLALIIGASINYRRLSNVDLSNNLRFFVFPMLAVLREDTAPGERVQIKLDLRPPTAKEKKTSESPPFAEGRYYKIVETFYVDPWFEGTTILADHSKLEWSIVDHIRERTKTKRNPRGKIKTKTKYTRKTEVDVRIGLPEKRYAVSGESSAEHAGNRNVMKRRRVLKTDNLEPLEPDVLMDLIAEGYRNAVPAKEAGA